MSVSSEEQDAHRANSPYQVKAMNIVLNYFNAHVEKTDGFTLTAAGVYVVWFAKTLQNWKALVSTVVPDGVYYEVTYDGSKERTYLDVYKKFDNFEILDGEYAARWVGTKVYNEELEAAKLPPNFKPLTKEWFEREEPKEWGEKNIESS